LVHINFLLPERNSRITGVPGHRLVVLTHQYRIDLFSFHATKIDWEKKVKDDTCYPKIGVLSPHPCPLQQSWRGRHGLAHSKDLFEDSLLFSRFFQTMGKKSTQQ
jgi:hypothetical protein